MPRLLIVDDSPLMRKLLGAIFVAEGDFTIEFARDGVEALERLAAFQPDVVTLDVQMPLMDGLACLDRIMIERPCPVVMISSLTAEGAAETLEALALGAVDFVPKPRRAISLEIDALAPHLVETVRSAAKARLRPTLRLAERIRLRNDELHLPKSTPPARVRTSLPAPIAKPRRQPATSSGPLQGLVLIGASTGGPPALDAVLSRLPASFPWPVVVAQHMPASFTGPLAQRLNGICALAVSEVTAPEPLESGRIYIGRGDADVLVGTRLGRPIVMPAPSSTDYRWHPSVDRLVESAMVQMEPRCLMGVLMTGMGNDGAPAMSKLRLAGGHTIAESEETAVVWGMPGELVRAGGAAVVAPLDMIADHVAQWPARH